MTAWTMPARRPLDGPVSVSRLGDGDEEMLRIAVETDGETKYLEVSPYNAARVFGMLAMFLEIPLPARIGKAIKF